MNGNRLLLDTNAIIALQRQNSSLINLIHQADDVFIPLTAVGELYFGAYKSTRIEENRENVARFLKGRVILNPDTNTANVYGLIKQQLRAKGRPIPENDIWIAAIAIQYDLELVTQDRHFSEVDNLKHLAW